MAIISLKLSDALDEQLSAAAQSAGESKSSMVRDAITSYLAAGTPSRREVSFLDVAGDLLGTGEGPTDLSTNKKHLRKYGK